MYADGTLETDPGFQMSALGFVMTFLIASLTGIAGGSLRVRVTGLAWQQLADGDPVQPVEVGPVSRVPTPAPDHRTGLRQSHRQPTKIRGNRSGGGVID